MSASMQTPPRVEMRAAFGCIPLFTPSYQVLRDPGMMRNTLGQLHEAAQQLQGGGDVRR